MNDNQIILQANRINKSYLQGDSRLDILENLSIDVRKGESVAIVGQSGSGKSTLLALLAGLDQPDSGSVILRGQNITEMAEAPLARLRGRSMGIVFQQFHLMPHLTAFENIALPLEILQHGQSTSSRGREKRREKRKERGEVKQRQSPPQKNIQELTQQALTRVGLGSRAQHLPHQLSGGECQRVAIARAFVIGPEVLLADEPSGNLDAETGEQITDLLFDMTARQQMTTILVTHNLALAKKCDRILTLQNGFLDTAQH